MGGILVCLKAKKVVDCRQGSKKGVVQVEIRELGLRW